MRQTIARAFDFDLERGRYTLSDATKLVVSHRAFVVELRKQSDGYYPLDDDLYVTTEVYKPTKVRAWLAVMPVVDHATVDGAIVTSVSYRLSDGTDVYYWDGAAWSVAGAADWTSLADLQANFAAFPATTRRLAIVASLSTTDKRYTPRLRGVYVALDVEIGSWQEEYIIDGLIPLLESNVTPSIDWLLKWPGGTTYDMASYVGDDGMTFADVTEAYDHDADPAHASDLFVSYDAGTLTLAEPLAAGTSLYFVGRPVITYALSVHQDYEQIGKTPALVLRDYEQHLGFMGAGEMVVVNYATGEAVVAPTPRIVDYQIPVDIVATRARVVMRIAEAMKVYAKNTQIVSIPGLDVEARLEIRADVSYYPRQDEESIVRGTIEIRLENCYEWIFDGSDGRAITQLVAGTDVS